MVPSLSSYITFWPPLVLFSSASSKNQTLNHSEKIEGGTLFFTLNILCTTDLFDYKCVQHTRLSEYECYLTMFTSSRGHCHTIQNPTLLLILLHNSDIISIC
uniref:Uncharacterized protein n=1 Tax=Gasterosteus aculeatus TaxID=69293 RepID=G3P616_GASAC